MKMINRLIFLSSIIGFAVSFFLAYEYNQSGPVPCPVGGNGCELVRQSEYSSLFGIFIPYYGIVFYLVIAGLCVWLVNKYIRLFDFARLAISFTGFLFGVYLTYLEAFVIKAYCFWCVTSFIISTLIFTLAFYAFIKAKKEIL